MRCSERRLESRDLLRLHSRLADSSAGSGDRTVGTKAALAGCSKGGRHDPGNHHHPRRAEAPLAHRSELRFPLLHPLPEGPCDGPPDHLPRTGLRAMTAIIAVALSVVRALPLDSMRNSRRLRATPGIRWHKP